MNDMRSNPNFKTCPVDTQLREDKLCNEAREMFDYICLSAVYCYPLAEAYEMAHYYLSPEDARKFRDLVEQAHT